MRKLFFVFISLWTLGVSAQSAKKQNVILKEQLVAAEAAYETQVAQYLSDFKVLEKTRKDYRAYSKNMLNNRQNDLKRQLAEMSRLMALCDDFKMDYTKLVDQVVLNDARAFTFMIDREVEKALLNEIFAFENVTIRLMSLDIKPKVENPILKEQIMIYANAQSENSQGIAAQNNAIDKLKKAAAQLDSAEKSCYRIIIEVDKSMKRLRDLTDLRYENECKIPAGTLFTFRYETEFLTKPAMAEPSNVRGKSLFESEIAEIPAEFPDGVFMLQQFINNNIQLPTAITDLGFEGKCYVQFIVKTTGEISDVVVVKGIVECPDCSKEASRLVKEMPKWIPGKTAGKEVDSRMVIPISFQVK